MFNIRVLYNSSSQSATMKGFYLKFTFSQEKLKTINQFKSHIEECFIETYGFVVLKYELIEVAKFHQLHIMINNLKRYTLTIYHWLIAFHAENIIKKICTL